MAKFHEVALTVPTLVLYSRGKYRKQSDSLPWYQPYYCTVTMVTVLILVILEPVILAILGISYFVTVYARLAV